MPYRVCIMCWLAELDGDGLVPLGHDILCKMCWDYRVGLDIVPSGQGCVTCCVVWSGFRHDLCILDEVSGHGLACRVRALLLDFLIFAVPFHFAFGSFLNKTISFISFHKNRSNKYQIHKNGNEIARFILENTIENK